MHVRTKHGIVKPWYEMQLRSEFSWTFAKVQGQLDSPSPEYLSEPEGYLFQNFVENKFISFSTH
jgi:hypothetical protein